MQLERFAEIIAALTARLAGKTLDSELQETLNDLYPPHGAEYQQVVAACRAAIDAGWMCSREAGGIKYGRVIEPGDRTHGFSVDVVDMDTVIGPHHSHPHGEIDLIMPLSADARFDGQGAGWRVYGAGSCHRPTVTGGRALVLYLLPEGSIEFTKS